MAKAAPAAKKEPVKSGKTWEITDDNEVTVTENGETTVVATLEYPETDPEQEGPANLHYVDDETKKTYGKGLTTFLADEKIPFNADAVSHGDTPLADRVKAENTDEFNAKVGPPPRQDIYRGDKTPKFVNWLKKNKPATYEQKYGIIGPGQVNKTREVINSVTGRPETQVYQVDAILARRKTHLTEKAEAGVLDEGEEVDRNPFLKE